MEVIDTKISGIQIIKPSIHKDQRGYFYESYNRETFLRQGIDQVFVQDNESLSARGVLRGLHFQRPPHAQGKLVRVIRGSVLDVVVDIRRNSPSYGEWESVVLTQDNKWMFWIPPGFAHGFVTLEENTIFSYKCTNVYNKASEGSIIWNDPDLNIDWKIDKPLLAEKDLNAPFFKNFKTPFN